MQMSNLQLAFENRLVVRCLRSEPSFDKVVSVLRQSAKDDLAAESPTTGATLLFYAVQRQNDVEAAALCKILCEDLAVCDAAHADCNKQTALFFAARDGNAHCVAYLLTRNCNPDHRDSASQTALFYAARDGRLEAVRALLDAKADINLADHLGQTALFYASRDGRLETVALMVERGANIMVRDRHRRTAVYYAQRNNHRDLVNILKIAGGGSGAVTPTHHSSLDVTNANQAESSELVQDPLPETQPTQRRLYRLCINGPNSTWIGAPPEQIEVFENLVPSVAVWSPTASSSVTDILTDCREQWQPIAISIVDHLTQVEGGWIFAKPVDCKAWGCPDYYDVISTPMDFTTLKKKFKSHGYPKCADYLADMRLIFANCFRYNKPESHVAVIARTVEATFKDLLIQHKLEDWISREEIIENWYKAKCETSGTVAPPDSERFMKIETITATENNDGKTAITVPAVSVCM